MYNALTKLIENSPLALIVIGLVLFLIGASGGSPRLALEVNELGWRIALAAMGAVVAGLGGLLMWRGGGDAHAPTSAKKYGLKITYPLNLGSVPTDFEVSGTYKKKPPDDSVVVIEMHPESRHYWFKWCAKFDEARQTWHARSLVGASPGETRVLMVAVMGRAGKSLYDYFHKVRDRKGTVSIDALPPDIVVCDEIKVVKKQP